MNTAAPRMSVQLAKSTAAAAAAAAAASSAGSGGGVDINAKQGRRTPLSLSGAGKSTGGGNKTESVEKKTDAIKNNEKSVNSNNGVEMKKLQNEQKKDEKTGGGSALEENGYTNGHKRNDSIGSNSSSSKNDDKKATTAAAATTVSENVGNVEKPVRESQRKKEKLQKEEKTISSPKKSESAKTNERSSRKIDKEKDEVSVKKSDIKSSQDSVTESATKKEQDKKSQESSNESVKSDEKKKNQQEPIVIDNENKTQNTQKTEVSSVKKGPGRPSNKKAPSDEMEVIVLDDEVGTPGQPEASSTPGKIIKHKQGPLCAEQKPTEETSAPDVGATIVTSSKSVSYSVVNESSTVTTVTTTQLPTQISRPVPGRISGRRSIRHLPEYSFENRCAGYYRPIPDDDRWPSSMNVTVGSEIPNESISSSFSFFSRGKKRERTPPPSSSTDSENAKSSINQIMDSQDSELSPKRARLDFSGLFGIMASPMTMLRAKFSRAKIQLSSTPNGKVKGKRNMKEGAAAVDENGGGDGDNDEENVVNVSGIVAEDVTAVIDDDDDDIENGVNNIDDDISIHEDGNGTESKQVINMNDKDIVDLQPDDNNKLLLDDNNDDIIIKEKLLTSPTNDTDNKRKMCNIM